MALHWLNPERYVNDIWFSGGGQDQWSIFSPILASAISAFGVDVATQGFYLLSGLTFVAGSWAMSSALMRNSGKWLAVLVLVSYPLCYSPVGMFYVREGFVTSRGFAIGLSLIAISMVCRRQVALGFLIHGMALALHPIMSLAPFAVSILLAVGRLVRTKLLTVGIAILLGGFIAGGIDWIPKMSGQWLSLVRESPLIFIDRWVVSEAKDILTPFGVLALAARFGAPKTRTLHSCGIVVGGLALAVSLVSVHIPVVLFLQAQFWRSLWFVQVLALVGAVDLVLRYLVRSRSSARLPIMLGILVIVGLGDVGRWVALGSVAILILKPRWMERLRVISDIYIHQRVALLMCGLIGVMLVPSFLIQLTLAPSPIEHSEIAYELVWGLMRTGGYGVLPLVIWWSILRMSNIIIITSLAIGMLVIAFRISDTRSNELRILEATYGRSSSEGLFGGMIPPGSVVYWPHNQERVWFELGTAGYASAVHCSGQVFSEQRVLVLLSRFKRIVASTDKAILSEPYSDISARVDGIITNEYLIGKGINPNSLVSYDASEFSADGIAVVCSDNSLDYVVGTHVSSWGSAYVTRVKDRTPGLAPKTYYLYRCAEIRNSTPIAVVGK